MTSRPLAVFGLLSSLACTHPADLDDDAWMVWQRLRTRWWIRGGDGVLRIPAGVWRAFHSRPGRDELMRGSANEDVRDLAARLDAEAAAAAIDTMLASHGVATSSPTP